MDLIDAAGKKIGAYSKGMRQRVKLAQAIAHDPELLILDEPLTGMDPIMRRRTIRLIKDWARAGKSIVVSSHILHEVEAMTSNILLINNGRILAEGNVHQIRDLIDEHPHTVFIRAQDPRALARTMLVDDGVISLRFEPGALVDRDGEARRVLRPADRHGGSGRRRRHRGSDLARRQPAGRVQVPGEAVSHPQTARLVQSALRVFDLSLGEMLWSRRTIFMALVVGSPVLLAIVARVVQASGIAPLRVNGVRVDAASMFGMMIWVLFLRFIVPVLGVFYGTSLIADEVEDKTITYLFTRPIRRGAVLVGKYFAYLVCTTLVVLPAVMIVYFLLVPFREIAGQLSLAGHRPRPARPRPGRLRRAVRAGRRGAEAAAGGRPGLRVRLGAAGDADAGLPPAVHPGLLPSGAGAARHARRHCRRRCPAAVGVQRNAHRP